MAKRARVAPLTLPTAGTPQVMTLPSGAPISPTAIQAAVPPPAGAPAPTATPPPAAAPAPATATTTTPTPTPAPAPATQTASQPTTDQFGLPTYLNLPNDIASGINYLLHPDFTESDQRAAEQAVAGGFGGSQFGDINNLRLRDSEKTARLQQAAQLLEPYQQRAQQTALQTQQILATHTEDVLRGQQALEQIQASDAGAMARLTAQERAALERQVLSGQQALAQINAKGGFDLQLTDKTLAAQMDQLNKKLQTDLQIASMNNQAANYRAGLTHSSDQGAANPTTPASTGFDSGATQAAINRILQQYGLTQPAGAGQPPANPYAQQQSFYNSITPAPATGSNFGGDFAGSLNYTGNDQSFAPFDPFASLYSQNNVPANQDFGGSLYYTGGGAAPQAAGAPEDWYTF